MKMTCRNCESLCCITVIYIIFYINHISIKNKIRTSLVAKWIGIHMPMQAMWV